jgi:hypothetical protein
MESTSPYARLGMACSTGRVARTVDESSHGWQKRSGLHRHSSGRQTNVELMDRLCRGELPPDRIAGTMPSRFAEQPKEPKP